MRGWGVTVVTSGQIKGTVTAWVGLTAAVTLVVMSTTPAHVLVTTVPFVMT